MTIEDATAGCGDGNAANLICTRGGGVACALHELHLREPCDERYERERDDDKERDELPRRARKWAWRFSDGTQGCLRVPER